MVMGVVLYDEPWRLSE